MTFPLQNWWWGLLSYGAAHVFHILIWRRGTPRRDVRCLVEVFFLPLLPALPLALNGEALAPLITHAVLAVHYIALYPAFQASSPTLHILDELARDKGGLTAAAVADRLSRLRREDERVEDLLASRLVVERDGRIRLSRRGRWVAHAFTAYRNLLGLPVGEG